MKSTADSYTCKFKDFPKFVPAEKNFWEVDFTLPKQGFTWENQLCADREITRYGTAVVSAKGNGHATATCQLRDS